MRATHGQYAQVKLTTLIPFSNYVGKFLPRISKRVQISIEGMYHVGALEILQYFFLFGRDQARDQHADKIIYPG